MPLAKRCKLKNSSKNTAKSIVLKVQKSDAPKNKSQLASRGVPRPPGTPLIYVPGHGNDYTGRVIVKASHGFRSGIAIRIINYQLYRI